MGDTPTTTTSDGQRTWTKPYYGVQHYPAGARINKEHWVTVEAYDRSATLNCWYPGCQFSPIVYHFSSVEDARREGERYADSAGALSPRETSALEGVGHADYA